MDVPEAKVVYFCLKRKTPEIDAKANPKPTHAVVTLDRLDVPEAKSRRETKNTRSCFCKSKPETIQAVVTLDHLDVPEANRRPGRNFEIKLNPGGGDAGPPGRA